MDCIIVILKALIIGLLFSLSAALFLGYCLRPFIHRTIKHPSPRFADVNHQLLISRPPQTILPFKIGTA
jgi:hypothetical protein